MKVNKDMKPSIYYLSLSLDERINYRSGWDIAVARESGTYNRFVESATVTGDVKKCAQKVYDIDRFYISLRTKRVR